MMDSNCTVSVLNRRSGGSTPSPFQAHIALAYIYGSRTVISGNVFMGATRTAIYTDSTDANIVILANMVFGLPFLVASPLAQTV
jgi:hypothetical protein